MNDSGVFSRAERTLARSGSGGGQSEGSLETEREDTGIEVGLRLEAYPDTSAD